MENIYFLDLFLILIVFFTFCQQLFCNKFNFYGIISLLSIISYFSIHIYYSGITIKVLSLILIGVLLIKLEFFIPSGISGMIGTFFILLSFFFVNNITPRISSVIIIGLLSFGCLFLFNIGYFKKKPVLLNRFVLDSSLSTEKGFVACETDNSLVNEILVSITDLRPSGIAVKDNKRYDVITGGEYIPKGSEVVVVSVKGMRVIVRKK